MRQVASGTPNVEPESQIKPNSYKTIKPMQPTAMMLKYRLPVITSRTIRDAPIPSPIPSSALVIMAPLVASQGQSIYPLNHPLLTPLGARALKPSTMPRSLASSARLSARVSYFGGRSLRYRDATLKNTALPWWNPILR